MKSELEKQSKKTEEEKQKDKISKLVFSISSSLAFKKGKTSSNKAVASVATAASIKSSSSALSKLNHIITKATHSKKKS